LTSHVSLTDWALILGASSGFGAATCRVLAHRGMNIAGIHLDSKATLPKAQAVIADVESAGREAMFINMNATNADKRAKTIERMAEAGIKVKVLLHSLAFGSLKPMVAETREESLDQKQLEMTLDVMAHSLVYWTQDLMREGLLGKGSKIFAMTSSGGERVFAHYGAVSAAKAYVAERAAIRNVAITRTLIGPPS